MVQQCVFYTETPIGELLVTGVFFLYREEWVTVGIVIDLCGFQFNLIYTDFPGEPINFADLVFIRTDNEELEDEMGVIFSQSFFPFNNISGSLEDGFKVSGFTILGINVLCSTINRNYEPIQSG